MTNIDVATSTSTLTLDTNDSLLMDSIKSATDISEPGVFQTDFAFSKQELDQIESFSRKIDVTNHELVLQYGSTAQRKIAAFSDATLERVKTKDCGFTGEMLTTLIDELKSFSAENTNFSNKSTWRIRRMFSKLKAQYSRVSTNISEIVDRLEEHQLILMQDLKVLNGLYDRNQIYFKEVSMYIIAGQRQLDRLRKTRLQELHQVAENTPTLYNTQAYKEYADACERFERKLHDLLISRTVAMQFAAQIRLLQNSDSILLEKIQSTIVNTIPLWKNQMMITLGIANATNAMQTQRAVSNATNTLLHSNSNRLKKGAIELARESERGIIDIETLTRTNQILIDTITEVQQIQETGRKQRNSAEAEMLLMEKDLKQKLMKV